MSKDNNKTKKSQVTSQNSNVSNDEFLEYYTKENFWDEHKKNADYLSDLYSKNSNFINYSQRTKYCSEFLTYTNNFDPKTGELTKKLTGACFCRVRLCPVCMWRRSLMWQARFYDAIPKIMSTYKDYRFLFLTLTIKNCNVSDLSKTLKLMNDSFRKMLKYKRISSVFEGWLKTTEITRNEKTNEAHPHFHLLVMVRPSYFKKNYIKQIEFIEMWQKALKINYLPNVDIRTVKNKHNNKDDLTTAVSELLKYSVKEGDLLADPKFLYVLTDEIYKKRFISSGGILKDILKLEKEETEAELLNDEQLEEIENLELEDDALIFSFNRNFKKYTKKRTHKKEDGLLHEQWLRRDKNQELKEKKIKQQQQQEQEALQQQIKQLNDDAINTIAVVDLEKEGGEIWKAL